jgi:hypothetical protein
MGLCALFGDNGPVWEHLDNTDFITSSPVKLRKKWGGFTIKRIGAML